MDLDALETAAGGLQAFGGLEEPAVVASPMDCLQYGGCDDDDGGSERRWHVQRENRETFYFVGFIFKRP